MCFQVDVHIINHQDRDVSSRGFEVAEVLHHEECFEDLHGEGIVDVAFGQDDGFLYFAPELIADAFEHFIKADEGVFF